MATAITLRQIGTRWNTSHIDHLLDYHIEIFRHLGAESSDNWLEKRDTYYKNKLYLYEIYDKVNGCLIYSARMNEFKTFEGAKKAVIGWLTYRFHPEGEEIKITEIPQEIQINFHNKLDF